MRNYELIKKIHEWTPKLRHFKQGGNSELSIDQLFDRCMDIVDLIERERPELAKDKDRFWDGGYVNKDRIERYKKQNKEAK